MSQETHCTTNQSSADVTPNGNPVSDNVVSGSAVSDIVSTIGYVLAFSYPLLAISTGFRAVYRLFFRSDMVNYWPPAMSAVAATCYLLATIGFAYRRKWSWWLSIVTLGIETILTLLIGTWSYIDPALIGRTVWRHFGVDYGYLPFFQPILGLIWLLWPATLVAYGIRRNNSATDYTDEG